MMKIKASLHLHSREDSEDGSIIGYSLFELIDYAVNRGFKVLASTCHEHNIATTEHVEYAKDKGILLLSGVELNISGGHILVLNCASMADGINNFEDLKKFKASHPEVFVIAAHPAHHPMSFLTLKKLEQNIDCIDAIEHSWFYIKSYNPNHKARKLADKYELPFIATADAHSLEYINSDYAEIELAELTPTAVFQAISAGKFKNYTKPKSAWQATSFEFWMYFSKLMSYFK